MEAPSNGRKPTYSQDWPAYNAAQTSEKLLFLQMLSELCDLVTIRRSRRRGRPTSALRDVIYCAILKIYVRQSGRRATSDFQIAADKHYITKAPHFNTVSNYYNNQLIEPILKHLVRVSSHPLAWAETTFAADSTGFSTFQFSRWFSFAHQRDVTYRDWVKLHIMCGTKTNVVTWAEITDGHSNDSPMLPGLVGQTAQSFNMEEITADAAYSSRNNLAAIAQAGALPYIPFKRNATRRKIRVSIWRKMFEYFQTHREEFLARYHRRSNVESVFHMMKRKFGNTVASKKHQGKVNELLCKVICHNLCVLIQEMHEQHFTVNFCAANDPAQQIIWND